MGNSHLSACLSQTFRLPVANFPPAFRRLPRGNYPTDAGVTLILSRGFRFCRLVIPCDRIMVIFMQLHINSVFLTSLDHTMIIWIYKVYCYVVNI
jgi:hypothetical protein